MSYVSVALLAGNLPTEVASFVGHQRDVTEVERLLATARLITLTGFGGVGKSRLALRVATRLQGSFRHGVWRVELAGVRDPELVAHTLAAAVQVGEQSGRPPLAALVDFLVDRQLLIVLDNCEHLSEACGVLAEALLREAPGVTILATSRQSLGLVGEYVWPLAPLAVPDPDGPLSSRVVQRFPALELFADRAETVRPGFVMTTDELRYAARICHRLDGIPLGIELAAVWLRTLGISEVAARLDDRFGLMTGASRTVLPRHKTLRAAVQWSYELCTVAEQALWARASVFAGTFDVAAAEAVCAGGELDDDRVPATLNALVDKSVLLCESDGAQPRYRMLETLREYGLERLHEPGVQGPLRRAHRDHYRRMAQECDAGWFGPGQLDWFARLQAEHANLRAALEFCLTEPGEQRAGLDMASALWFYWIACGQLREGRHWLDRALAQAVEPSRERAGALAINGYVAVLQADLDAGEAMLAQGRTLARELGDDHAYARATLASSIAAFHRMDLDGAVGLQREAQECMAALAVPDSMEPVARVNVALQHAMVIDPVLGVELCAQCCRVSEAEGDLWVLSWADFGLANARWLQGRPQEATRYGRRCLWGKWRFADALGVVVTVELLAWIAAAAGECERAAALLGASRQTFHHFGLRVFDAPHFAGPHDTCEAVARAALGATGFSAAFSRGAAFTIDQAIAYALGEQALDHEPGLSTALAGSTSRELQVADAAGQDLSNEQVASRLMIAQQQRDVADLMRREIIELSGILDPDKVVDRLSSTLTRVLPADVALIVRTGPTGFTMHFPGAAVPTELGTPADPALTAIMASLAATRGSTDQLPPPLAGRLCGIRCWLAIPLTSRSQPAGLLVLASTTLSGYDEAQLKIAVALAAQAMIAYDNALLFQRVEQLATIDGLTGLNNRRHFEELAGRQVAIAARQGRPLSVAMLDIDFFKKVNDAHGHAVGDEVIRAVAARISGALRTIDIVCRYGGEEFAIVLPETGKQVGPVAERIRLAVAATAVSTAAGPLQITVSVGTAVRHGPESSLDSLLDRADQALYEAKQAGRDRIVEG